MAGIVTLLGTLDESLQHGCQQLDGELEMSKSWLQVLVETNKSKLMYQT